MSCSSGKGTIRPINAGFCAVTSWQQFLFICLEKWCQCAKHFAVHYIINGRRIDTKTERVTFPLAYPRPPFLNIWEIKKKKKSIGTNEICSEIISYSATEGVWLLWCQAMKYLSAKVFLSDENKYTSYSIWLGKRNTVLFRTLIYSP
jgi:hypothetical protein